MKINIIEEPKEVNFETIAQGDVFIHQDHLYMRTNTETIADINSVNLETGKLVWFNPSDKVTEGHNPTLNIEL